jgi:hypothetical protein
VRDKDDLKLISTCEGCKIYDNDFCSGQYSLKGAEIVSCPAYIKKGTSGVIPKELKIPFPIKPKKRTVRK